MYIIIEGIDGSGKTTLAQSLVDKLNSIKHPAVFHAEPSQSEVGKLIRRYLSGDACAKDPRTLLYLFATDRLESNRVVEDYIKQGIAVVSDRSWISTWCYQGRLVDQQCVSQDEFKLLCRGARADLEVILACDVDEALRRIGARSGKEIFERKDVLEAVAKRYEKLYEEFPSRSMFGLSATLPTDVQVNLILRQLYCDGI